ncbi:MAG: AbrB/MazE/SpoVT family DNA-binding domain-containing protein [Ilumatobacteraceae bacterium]|jgi:AbrB family looped-hinge helix DNA binding protein|nr:AbrB/MazE/SpoVT family DNA-binding domain-containing protein [Ilumatobacteraceae bacterium]
MSDTIVVKVGPKGRIVIPAGVRDECGIHEGDELVVVVERTGIRLVDRRGLVASLRGSVRSVDGRSVVDELLAERRAEAVAEAHG